MPTEADDLADIAVRRRAGAVAVPHEISLHHRVERDDLRRRIPPVVDKVIHDIMPAAHRDERVSERVMGEERVVDRSAIRAVAQEEPGAMAAFLMAALIEPLRDNGPRD